MITFKLDWPPTVNTYWRVTKDARHAGMRVHLSNKGRKYKEQAYLQMLEQSVLKGTESARYEVLIDAYVPDRRRRDLDNILKPLLDVMEEYGVVPDDEQIDVLTVRRRERGGYVIVNVLEIEPEYSLAS